MTIEELDEEIYRLCKKRLEMIEKGNKEVFMLFLLFGIALIIVGLYTNICL